MKYAALGLLLAILLVAGWGIRTGISGSYAYEAQIMSYWNLADKSSTIAQKSAYVDQFVDVLGKQGFQGKHNAVIYPTMDNSFDKNYEALKTLQTRLREIQTMDIKSFEYQTAIQQITAQEQGEAKSMLDVFEGIWWLQNYPLLWDWYGVLLVVGLVLAGAVDTFFFIMWADE